MEPDDRPASFHDMSGPSTSADFAAAQASGSATGKSAPSPQLSWDAPFSWEMIFLVAAVSIEQRMRCAEALKTFGLTPPQFGALVVIGRNEGTTAAKLARLFRVRRQTIAEVVAHLTGVGLIRVQASEGRRDRLLELTPEGRDRWNQADAAILAVEHGMFAQLSPARLEQLREILSELHGHLGIGGAG